MVANLSSAQKPRSRNNHHVRTFWHYSDCVQLGAIRPLSEVHRHHVRRRQPKLARSAGASPAGHQGDLPDREFGSRHSCSEFTPPIAKIGPHAAALGMRFYTGTMFPLRYGGGIFIARHGSWDKIVKIGADLIYVTLNRDGTVRSWEPFMTRFLKDNVM
jgi:hypothetical protein